MTTTITMTMIMTITIMKKIKMKRNLGEGDMPKAYLLFVISKGSAKKRIYVEIRGII